MTVMWNVKAIYGSGDHVLTDKSGNRLRFNSEAAAADEAAMRNLNRQDNNVYYITVKEQ